MKNKVTPSEVIDLVRRLPDANLHIHEWKGKQCITQEWLAGGFCGRCFEGNTLEDAAQQMIDYLNEHMGHDSMVGRTVTESGWPDLEAVEDYCLSFIDTEEVTL